MSLPIRKFFDQEFANIKLNDSRLSKRAITIGNNLIENPDSCIQTMMKTKNQARCAYDFFSNPKIKWHSLLASHKENTIQRIIKTDEDYIYIIQDSTFYNYTKHKAKIDLGIIGKQGRQTQFGFLQHTSFCITFNDTVLGILELDFIGYEDDEKHSVHRNGFEKIASGRWRRFLSQNIKQLEGLECRKKIILLCDREADFFELHDDLRHGEFKFIIRSKWNRYTGQSARARKNKILDLLDQEQSLGTVTIKVMNPGTHKQYNSDFNIKILKNILIPAIHRGAGHKQNSLKPVTMNIVEANDGNIKWVLLTNLSVDTIEDAIFVIESYKKRWHIESFHKVLKTAYNADKIYLHSSREAIQNLLTIINIAACQTYSLIHQARVGHAVRADMTFSTEEIVAANIFCNNKLIDKNQIPSLRDFYYIIAKLGGYKNFSNKHPPGILTIYRGIKKLHNITEMYNIMMSIKT